MSDYISREAAIAFMNEVEPCICHDPAGEVFTATKDKDMLEFLRDIPAADVVEVRHGRWERVYPNGPRLRCSLCRSRSLYAFYYCPDCGAVMDGGMNERTD